MRRLLLAPLLAVLLGAGGSGCAGSDGAQAQELLTRSQQAVARVESFRFAARVWMSGSAEGVVIVMRGGGYARGKRAGDFFVRATVEGIPGLDGFTLVSKGGTDWMNSGDGWVPVPKDPAVTQAQAALGGFDFTPYLQDVRVEPGQLVGGEPMTKISGVVDTDGLVDGVLGQLGGVTQMGSLGSFGTEFGDTRAVVYVSEVTNLPVRGLVDLTITALGESVTMHLDYALQGVDEPVKIPEPS